MIQLSLWWSVFTKIVKDLQFPQKSSFINVGLVVNRPLLFVKNKETNYIM